MANGGTEPGADGVAVAANPYSGSGRNRAHVRALADALARHGLRPALVWDRARLAAVLGSRDAAQGYRSVVAAGGDGTVADVINAGTELPLATLPLGNENLFAGAFGFDGDVEALARSVAAARCRTVDLGRANGRRFSLMVSAGLDADVVHRVARWRAQSQGLRRVRHVSYVCPALAALRQYRFSGLTLEADGERVEGTQALVFNVPAYACQTRFAPDARPDDGWLDWVVFRNLTRSTLLPCLWATLRGRHRRRPDVRWGRARRLRLTAAEPVPVQMDGEAFGTTPVEMDVEPRALRVIVPWGTGR